MTDTETTRPVPSAQPAGDPTGMTLPPTVATAREVIRPAMEQALERLTPMMRRVAGYHLGMYDRDGNELTSGGGKTMRPALVMLSARAAGVEARHGIPAAVAVELVHNFSLLHDDIMDGDTERRHRPTAWTVFGSSAAILAGDALLTVSQELLLDEGSQGAYWAARCLAAATQRLITGQTADLDFEQRDDVTLDECVTMASDKTGALLACACSVGAMLQSASPRMTTGLADFGARLGLAFQLVDDLLGIWGDPAVTGKPVLSDLRARKKSLPVVAALQAGTPDSRRLGELLRSPDPLTEEDLTLAAKLVEDAGGRQWCEREAERQLDAAERGLTEVGTPADVREEFMHIARFITARDR